MANFHPKNPDAKCRRSRRASFPEARWWGWGVPVHHGAAWRSFGRSQVEAGQMCILLRNEMITGWKFSYGNVDHLFIYSSMLSISFSTHSIYIYIIWYMCANDMMRASPTYNGATTMVSHMVSRHHLDYDLQQSQRAGPYYKRAVELESNNPVFVPFGLRSVELCRAWYCWTLLVPEKITEKWRLSLVELVTVEHLRDWEPRRSSLTVSLLDFPFGGDTHHFKTNQTMIGCPTNCIIDIIDYIYIHVWYRKVWYGMAWHGMYVCVYLCVCVFIQTC